MTSLSPSPAFICFTGHLPMKKPLRKTQNESNLKTDHPSVLQAKHIKDNPQLLHSQHATTVAAPSAKPSTSGYHQTAQAHQLCTSDYANRRHCKVQPAASSQSRAGAPAGHARVWTASGSTSVPAGHTRVWTASGVRLYRPVSALGERFFIGRSCCQSRTELDKFTNITTANTRQDFKKQENIYACITEVGPTNQIETFPS